MKSTVKILAVVMVCILASTVLVACALTPNINYDKACANLEKNDYTVDGIIESDTNFEEEFDGAYATNFGIEASDFHAGLMAFNDDNEFIAIFWLKSIAAAKKCYQSFQEFIENSSGDKEFCCGRSDNVVWMGSEEAIKATK